MLMANLLPDDTLNVVRHVEDVLDQINAERTLKLAFVQIATRIDSLMRLESQTQVRQRDGHRDMKNLICRLSPIFGFHDFLRSSIFSSSSAIERTLRPKLGR